VTAEQFIPPFAAEHIGHFTLRGLTQKVRGDFDADIAERFVHGLNSSGDQCEVIRIIGDFGMFRSVPLGNQSCILRLIIRPPLTSEGKSPERFV
jgi:hypothetical protein